MRIACDLVQPDADREFVDGPRRSRQMREPAAQRYGPRAPRVGKLDGFEPYLLERMLPYAVLIGSMLALTRLTRTHELIVARAAGVSVWQFLSPALLVVGALGIFSVAVFNPLSAALLLRFEQMEARNFSGKPSLLVISSSGLWMRQMEENPNSNISEHIINAAKVTPHNLTFSNVIIFSFGKQKEFIERLDAQKAELVEIGLGIHPDRGGLKRLGHVDLLPVPEHP